MRNFKVTVNGTTYDVAVEETGSAIAAEAPVVAALLGKRMHRDGYLRLYHPDLSDLRAKIPDCVMIVFTP